ncbi:MAG: enoyl-CoA hydratase/isomerase family protein [Polaromonas sp.]|uniref:enoyl-CoA hydratase/isomerase family protein n=1 Tax=Polaromonas sp. TaxID=1869339 RepID=UPI00273388FC|nr:enoyl-CoA hydratase/isomerase family protein [Polaromonas sp.]MDP3798072.1 enoyl-CoA hydratase/isomerase family protein [Polaromonas sp.]
MNEKSTSAKDRDVAGKTASKEAGAGIKSDILVERRASAGLITLNRPKALNALSLQMVRDLSSILRTWRDDPSVLLVAIRGTNKIGRPGTPESLFGGFCAGGDIRFFHQAALAGESAALDDFFTEEYTLNHLIHNYPKPYIAFMDGTVMGGGMGISQGAKVRIVTEHTKMAMPETQIGLFPDVGGGYFLSRCPGHAGEYLALTGEVIGADEAIAFGLADIKRDAARLPALWNELGNRPFTSVSDVQAWIATELIAESPSKNGADGKIDAYFSLLRVKHIVDALEAAEDPWAAKTAAKLRTRSPLMLHVTLEQIRRARGMSLADDLRMERDMVHHCFHLHPGAQSETVEGIRALAIDKDYRPRWNPARIEDVKPGMADAFFASPWTAELHPLRDLC